MSQVDKVYAYITRADKLLVFKHVDFPEAGIQIPGGSMEAWETPEMAVMREVEDETGLRGLVLKKYLGKDESRYSTVHPSESISHHFFHLLSPREAPDIWQHNEQHPSDGSPAPILFEFYWLSLSQAAGTLDPYFSVKLKQLHKSIAGN